MLFTWFVLSLLVLANALYVAAEFSSVAAQRGRIAHLAESGNRRARVLLAILADGIALDRYIAACQIGITLTSLIVGAYGQATLAPAVTPVLEDWFELSPASATSAAVLVVLVVLTVIQVMLGELVPKSLALQFPERTALITLLPTRWSASVFRWFIALLNGSAFLVLRPFGVRPGSHQHVHSPEEIEILIAESQRGGAMSGETSERLQRGLHLSERTVRGLMVPRDEIYGVDESAPPDEVLARATASPYSRIVVYRGSLEHVIGGVNIKTIAARYAESGQVPALATLVKPLPAVQDTLRADQLVHFLQQHRVSKALVVDAEQRVCGFVSIEDILEAVFGSVVEEPPPIARTANPGARS